MKYRMVRQFGNDTSDNKVYRVETVECLTAQEAMQLLRDLGSPYNGRLYDDRPTGRD